MNSFLFTLKDNNQKAFNSFFVFLLFLYLIAASYILFYSDEKITRVIAMALIAIFIIISLIFYLQKNKFNLFLEQKILFVAMVLFWVMQKAWLPAIISIAVIGFAFYVLQKKSTFYFSAQNIVFTKSLFKKTYNWADIENVVLKDNLLSVDFKNNHLLQIEIAPESVGINEKIFNKFCQNQLLIT